METKILFKKIVPPNIRLKIKKTKRRVKNLINIKKEKLTLHTLKQLFLDEFGIIRGDNLIVSSSFGNLNTNFSPLELIKLLQDTIGPEGNLVMPFYPPGNSYEWAANNAVFDMDKTRSSMGILTQIFSEIPEVYKSIHPTKAVVAWGKNAKEIISGHDSSTTPFYWDSPYGWLLKNSSKSIGLGIKSNPIFHACEDILLPSHDTLYFESKHSLKVKSRNDIFHIETFIHDPNKMSQLIEIGDYIRTLKLSSYIRVKTGYTYSYCLNNQELFNSCKRLFESGNFRSKK